MAQTLASPGSIPAPLLSAGATPIASVFGSACSSRDASGSGSIKADEEAIVEEDQDMDMASLYSCSCSSSSSASSSPQLTCTAPSSPIITREEACTMGRLPQAHAASVSFSTEAASSWSKGHASWVSLHRFLSLCVSVSAVLSVLAVQSVPVSAPIN